MNKVKEQTLGKTNIAIAVYDNHTPAESAVKKLQRTGFGIKKISILGKDYGTEDRPTATLRLSAHSIHDIF